MFLEGIISKSEGEGNTEEEGGNNHPQIYKCKLLVFRSEFGTLILSSEPPIIFSARKLTAEWELYSVLPVQLLV